MSGISRDELVRRLAEVSRLTYVRQKNRDHDVPLEELSLAVTDHDRERAEDTVAELERLGVYPALVPGQESDDRVLPEAGAPAQPSARPVTDIWGNPITRRKGRSR